MKKNYTIKDVIFDPADPRLEGAIGKKVYCGSTPYMTLSRAKGIDKDIVDTYRGIKHTDISDLFLIEENQIAYDCIILKKEELKPKYVPFESAEEFIEAFDKHTYPDKNSNIKTILYISGMWLINTKRERPTFEQVIAIQDVSVLFGTMAYSYPALLEDFTFLDGTPCGEKVE